MNSVQQADHPPVQHYRSFDGGGLTTTNREQFATLTYEKGNHRWARILLGCTTKIPENPRTVLPTTTSFFFGEDGGCCGSVVITIAGEFIGFRRL